MIYATPYDPLTLACTGPSSDSGFDSLDDVPLLLGEPDGRHSRMLTYVEAGVAYTDFVLSVDTGGTDAASSPQASTGSS